MHRFTPNATWDFARLSGDFNPLHVDPVEARRSPFGANVVHGVHGLLWALDRLAAEIGRPVALQTLKATFHNPILVGDTAEAELRVKDDSAEIAITSGGVLATEAQVGFQPASDPGRRADVDAAFAPESPDEPGPETIANLAGCLPLRVDAELGRTLFPALMAGTTQGQVALVLAATRLVGMKAPGLQSVFCELDLAFDQDQRPEALDYRVSRYRPRFGLLELDVAAGGSTGKITALVRTASTAQPEFAAIHAGATPGEFANVDALIVGGSRGLGEVLAKLIAAGGGRVTVTYNLGRADADRVCAEIGAGGGMAQGLQLDVEAPAASALEAAVTGRTHLFYFATPPIRRESAGTDRAALFERYGRFYVTGFHALATAFYRAGGQVAVQPSTVFLETLPDEFLCYAMAKSAAETLCSALTKRPGLTALAPRLPMLATDQTAGAPGRNRHDAVAVLREMMRGL